MGRLLDQGGPEILRGEVLEVHRDPCNIPPEPRGKRLPSRLWAVAIEGKDRAPSLPQKVVHLPEVSGEGLILALEHGGRHGGLGSGVAVEASWRTVPTVLHPGRPGVAAESAGLLRELHKQGSESREGTQGKATRSRVCLKKRRHPRIRGVQQPSCRCADVRP